MFHPEHYQKLANICQIASISSAQGGQSSVVVFNPLAERVSEVVSVFVETSDVCVVDAATGKEIVYQVCTKTNNLEIYKVIQNKLVLGCVKSSSRPEITFLTVSVFLIQQINPTWNVSGFFRLDVTFVEISFVAVLDPLSVSRFEVRQINHK